MNSFQFLAIASWCWVLVQLSSFAEPITGLTTWPFDAVLPLILQNHDYCSIDRLIEGSCLSTRQFERTFLNRMGMPAKQYLRIVRFGRAYLLKDSQPQLPWLDLALHCGYYDYAHMVKDFVELVSQTPPALRQSDLKEAEAVYTAFR